MNSFTQLLYRTYKRFSDRTVMILIFVVSAVIHISFTIGMELPSIDPNEFGVLANTALFTGKDWSSLTSLIDYYGYIQGLLYVPFMLFTDDALAQYKAMLIFNGLLVSLVPVIAYKISLRLGIRRPWQSLTIAFCCGMYSTYLAHSKFVWNETICIVMIWIVALLILRCGDMKNKVAKHFCSVLTAFALAVTYASQERMFAVVIAAVLCILISRFVFRKKSVYLSSFLPTMVLFFLLEKVATGAVQTTLWLSDGKPLGNTFSQALSSLGEAFAPENIGNFFTVLFGHLYYFVSSTWGIGALALGLFFITTGSLIYRKFKHMELKYSTEYYFISFFAFFAVSISIFSSVLYKLEVDSLLTMQDTAIFGRYMDYAVPFAILAVLAYLFLYGLDFMKTLSAIISMSVIYTLFFLFSEEKILDATSTHISSVLALYPIRIGENISSLFTHNTFMLTTSCAFSLIALVIVVTCCSKRFRTRIIAFSLLVLVFYSSIYTAMAYLPMAADEAAEKNAPTVEISEYVYNKDDAPTVTVYSTTRHTATLLQFLNQNTLIIYKARAADIEENCFIVTPKNKQLNVADKNALGENIPLIKLAETDDFALYAYGERALAYARSQGDALAVMESPVSGELSE